MSGMKSAAVADGMEREHATWGQVWRGGASRVRSKLLRPESLRGIVCAVAA